MIKNKIKNKLFLLISVFIIITIITVFPKKETINYKIGKSNNNLSVIYLLDKNGYVSRLSIINNETEIQNIIKRIISYLTINSEDSLFLQEGFFAIIPAKTKLLNISINKDIVTLNFSKEILNISESQENKMISSIIYSLTSINDINKVKILVEGKEMKNLPHSQKELPSYLTRDFGINHIYDINTINNITKTTVYFLSKYKDYYYYTPISYISNNNNEKMQIIIEEMASKSTYETDLISYINNIKEVNYEIENEKIEIHLSNYLFNNLNPKELLNQTIYTINLSINENYSQKKVVYYIEDQIYQTNYLS